MNNLLIELRTEELPFHSLKTLKNAWQDLVFIGLKEARLLEANAQVRSFATPRRLAVLLSGVKETQAAEEKIKKGPSEASAFKDKEPTRALLGFLQANHKSLTDIELIKKGKESFYGYRYQSPAQPLAEILQEILGNVLKKLPIPRPMKWGAQKETFVRPLQGLVVLYNDAVLPIELLGLKAGRSTLGHRVLAKENPLRLKEALHYEKALQENYVIASFEERKNRIKEALGQYQSEKGLQYLGGEELMEESVALTEYPVVLEGMFPEEFLQVPSECLILTMQKNQKYFPLQDKNNKLTHRFLLVANTVSSRPEAIIAGNQRVVKARLEDARFFYQEDQKKPLLSRLNDLKQVVYHHKLGSIYEKSERQGALAIFLAQKIGADPLASEKAARLGLADLNTEMVGEFPELQGVMGKYYALNEGIEPEIATAIEQRYWPRFAEDKLPEGKVAQSVALADKLETLVGIWGIGLAPTGEKDPYALRRAALGANRLLANLSLNVKEALNFTVSLFEGKNLALNTGEAVYDFMKNRLLNNRNKAYSKETVLAVLGKNPPYFNHLEEIFQAVEDFRKEDFSSALLDINKRVHPLLKEGLERGTVDPRLISEAAEKRLWSELQESEAQVKAALAREDYQEILRLLGALKPAVDQFFAEVLVMDKDEDTKQNRLNLLARVTKVLNTLADLSLLT